MRPDACNSVSVTLGAYAHLLVEDLRAFQREIGLEWSGKRESNPRPSALGKRSGRLVGPCRQSQAVATLRDSHVGRFHSVAFSASFCSPFAAPVLQALLTVREVATQLGVST